MRTMCARVVMLAAVLSGAVPIAARTVTNDFLLSHSAKSGLTTERSRPHRERESSRSERAAGALHAGSEKALGQKDLRRDG
jgi:hypothetical protein